MAEPYDEETLLGYLEGDLSPQKRARFEDQLRLDARLRNLIAQLQRDRQQLRQIRKDQAPPELMDRINQRMEREMLLGTPATDHRGTTARRRITPMRLMAASAVAALIIVCVSLLLYTLNPVVLWLPASEDELILAMNEKPASIESDMAELLESEDGVETADSAEPAVAPPEDILAIGQPAASKAGPVPVSSQRDWPAAETATEPPSVSVDSKATATKRSPLAEVDRTVAEPSLTNAAQAFPDAPMQVEASPAQLVVQRPAANESKPAIEAGPSFVRSQRKIARSDTEGVQRLESLAMQMTKVESAAAPPVQWPALAIDAETVELQMTITTDDPPACVAQLRDYARAAKVDISMIGPEPLPPEAGDVAAAAKAKERLAMQGEPAPAKLVLQMPSELLFPLVAKLNALERQSARFVRTRVASRAPTNDPGRGIWRDDSDAMLAQERSRIDHEDRSTDDELLRFDWGALLNEQLPVSPVVPVFDPGTRLILKVFVYKNRETAVVERQLEVQTSSESE